MKSKGKRFSDTRIKKPAPISDKPLDAPISDASSQQREEEHPAEKKREIERELRQKEKNRKKLDRLIKRREHRERHSSREVLSYEDMPLREREPEPGPVSPTIKKRVVVAAIIIAAVGLAVFIFASADSMSFENIKNFVTYGIFGSDSEEGFPVDIQSENISDGNFTRIGQNLCYASDSKFCVLNSYGRTVYSVQSGLSSPVIATDHRLSLVYSLSGTAFSIYSSEDEVYSGTAPDSIFLGDIVDNGTYAFVTRDDGYNAKLYVYDKDNNRIFAYSFADYYITAMALSPSGREAIVAGVSALNGEEYSCVYVLDFTKAEPEIQQEIEGNIIYDVDYLSDSYACIIGGTASYGLRVHSGNFVETAYDGRTLTAYDINTDTDNFTISLSRSGDGRNCDILTFNTNGSLSNTISTELRVASLSTYKNRVAVLSDGAVVLYSKDSRLISTTPAGIDPHAVVLYTKDSAYVLGTSEIISLSL